MFNPGMANMQGMMKKSTENAAGYAEMQGGTEKPHC